MRIGVLPMVEEPHSVVLKVYVTRTYAAAVDRVAAELRLSKSLLLREAVRRGLPALVNDVALLRSKGFRPAAHLEGMVAGSGTSRCRWGGCRVRSVVEGSGGLRGGARDPGGADRP